MNELPRQRHPFAFFQTLTQNRPPGEVRPPALSHPIVPLPGVVVLRPAPTERAATYVLSGVTLPVAMLVGACGLLLVAGGYAAARGGQPFGPVGFWLGLVVLFAPFAALLVHRDPSRAERIAGVLALALGLYLVKVLHSPTLFVFHDELLHIVTLNGIARSGHLFSTNSLLPASPLFPGLEIVTHAAASLTGLSLTNAGLLVVGVARLVGVLALFLLFEAVSGSARVAGIAALVYMANPNFTPFDAQFAYESLALPFAALTVYAFVRAARVGGGERACFAAVAVLGLGLVTVTHHVTTYVLVAFLAAWWAVQRCISRPWGVRFAAPTGAEPAVGGFALSAAALAGAWLLLVAPLALDYLRVPVAGGLAEFGRLLSGQVAIRPLFQAYGGQTAPLAERVAGIGATLILLAAIPFALRHTWRERRTAPLPLTFALAAAAYPAALALRFTSPGLEVGSRLTAFLFVGIAFTLADWYANRSERPGASSQRGVAPFPLAAHRSPLAANGWLLTAAITVVFLGGVATGWGPSVSRLPGSHLVGADARSVDAHGLAAAAWMRERLGPDNRVIADRITRLLLAAEGEQRPVTGIADGFDTSPVLVSPRVDDYVLSILRRGRVAYLVVDHRLSIAAPLLGIYVEQGEPGTFAHTAPLGAATLGKFDGVPGVSRVYDDGTITIYDVRGIADAYKTP